MKAILGPAGSSTSVSARRLAARKSRLSIIADVRVRWLTIDPARGRQDEPVWRSNWSAAWSRKNSMLLRRSMSVMPSASEAFEVDRADLRAVLFLLAALLGVLVVVELALNPVGGAVEEVDRRPEQIVEVGFEARVAQGRDQRVEDIGDGAADGVGFGQRSGVGFVLEGSVAIELQFGEKVIG